MRTAIEAKDINRVAENYLTFSDRQRRAVQAYMDAAENLRIEFADVTTEREGADLAVSFTRRDQFDDRKTGREVRLEVRITKILVLHEGRLKIGPSGGR